MKPLLQVRAAVRSMPCTACAESVRGRVTSIVAINGKPVDVEPRVAPHTADLVIDLVQGERVLYSTPVCAAMYYDATRLLLGLGDSESFTEVARG